RGPGTSSAARSSCTPVGPAAPSAAAPSPAAPSPAARVVLGNGRRGPPRGGGGGAPGQRRRRRPRRGGVPRAGPGRARGGPAGGDVVGALSRPDRAGGPPDAVRAAGQPGERPHPGRSGGPVLRPSGGR